MEGGAVIHWSEGFRVVSLVACLIMAWPIIILAGMRRTQAYTIYYAVRVFGGSHWSRS